MNKNSSDSPSTPPSEPKNSSSSSEQLSPETPNNLVEIFFRSNLNYLGTNPATMLFVIMGMFPLVFLLERSVSRSDVTYQIAQYMVFLPMAIDLLWRIVTNPFKLGSFLRPFEGACMLYIPLWIWYGCALLAFAIFGNAA